MRNYPGLTVEDMRIEGDYQILKLGGPVVPERNREARRNGLRLGRRARGVGPTHSQHRRGRDHGTARHEPAVRCAVAEYPG